MSKKKRANREKNNAKKSLQKAEKYVAEILVRSDKPKPLKYSFNDCISIGSGAKCDVCVNGKGISPLHCKIVRKHDIFILFDVSNQKRTWLRGNKIKNACLRESDWFLIGGKEIEPDNIQDGVEITFKCDKELLASRADVPLENRAAQKLLDEMPVEKVKTRPNGVCSDCRGIFQTGAMIKCKYCGELSCEMCSDYNACASCCMICIDY